MNRRGSLASTRPPSIKSNLSRTSSFGIHKKKDHILILREEKERFEAMRNIQKRAEAWKRWIRLSLSVTAFGIFWCVGAVVFWQVEQETLDMTYWESVYYGWITLITIGYGDFSPHSVAGRAFFVVWVQFAVPALTVVAENLSITVVEVFSSSTSNIASTILPRHETLLNLQYKFPWLFSRLPYALQKRILDRDADNRVLHGFEVGFSNTSPEEDEKITSDDAYAAGVLSPDIAALEEQHRRDLKTAPDATALARQLALAIKRCAMDMHGDAAKSYAFEEWVEFTRLIRFTAVGEKEAHKEEDEEGMVHWDWLAENSPLMSEQKEAEFVLDRLCESMVRYLRRNPPNPTFAEGVKARGEDHLRLRNGGWHEGDVQKAHESKVGKAQAAKNVAKEESDERRPSLIQRIMGGPLHPVEEHHDEDQIKPVHRLGRIE
jgi:potassium channel subfamily K, other eukaryote